MEYIQGFSNSMVAEPSNILENIKGFTKDDAEDDTKKVRKSDYETGKWFVRALSISLKRNKEVPRVISVISEPDSGKTHAIMDIAARIRWRRLYDKYKGREWSEEELWELAREEESWLKTPMDVIYWGDNLSLAKLKGIIPRDVKYGSFTDQHLSDASQIFKEEIRDAIAFSGVSAQQALISEAEYTRVVFVECPATTGAFIKGKFVGKDRGFTALRSLSLRQGVFKGLHYEDWWAVWVADNVIKRKGQTVEEKFVQAGDDPEKIAQVLAEENEQLGQADVEQEAILVDYRQEGASVFASNLLESQTNDLAFALKEAALINFNSDRFLSNPAERLKVIRHQVLPVLVGRGNLWIRNRLLLGLNTPKMTDKVPFNLRANVRNWLRYRYPEIAEIAKTNK